jgi:hypothetical protein
MACPHSLILIFLLKNPAQRTAVLSRFHGHLILAVAHLFGVILSAVIVLA